MLQKAAPLGSLFTPDFAEEPFWWEAARPEPQPSADAPPSIDVAIIGAGITGLNAAIELARAGKSVALFDAEEPGFGASTRNAGFAGRTFKHEFRSLAKKYGLDYAVRVHRELHAAFLKIESVIAEERIDCSFKRNGRLILAATERQFLDLVDELEAKRTHLGEQFEVFRQHELPREIASNRYFGGALVADIGSLHPGLYVRGLLARAKEAGAIVVPRCAVTAIAKTGDGRFRIDSKNGVTTARDVLVATNGYSGGGVPGWIRRRLVPFDAYMIATEELSPQRIEQILPGDRTYLDTSLNLLYARRSPDHKKILFGARTGSKRPASRRVMAAKLHADMSDILPALSPVRLSRAWTGKCAATFDLFPHAGQHDGIWFAGGYCFSGVPMGTYLGRKIAAQILGRADGSTIFSERKFSAMPFYSGNPWFVPYAMSAANLVDRFASRGRPR